MDWKHPFGRHHDKPVSPAAMPLAAAGGPAVDAPDLGTGDATVDQGGDGLADGPFADWVLRPDVTGRLGWEPPDLPDAVRWWARSTFDDLPTLRPQPRRPGIDPCGWCGRRDWWRSVTWPDVVRCGWCHPPLSGPGIEWLNRGEAASE